VALRPFTRRRLRLGTRPTLEVVAARLAAVGNGNANRVTPREKPRATSPAVDMVTDWVTSPLYTFASCGNAAPEGGWRVHLTSGRPRMQV